MNRILLIGLALLALTSTAQAQSSSTPGGDRPLLFAQQLTVADDPGDPFGVLPPVEPLGDGDYTIDPLYPPLLYVDDVDAE